MVRAWAAQSAASRQMAIGEIVLVVVYYFSALLYLRPYTKEAQRLAKELLDKVKVPHG